MRSERRAEEWSRACKSILPLPSGPGDASGVGGLWVRGVNRGGCTVRRAREELAEAFRLDEFPRSAKYEIGWVVGNMLGPRRLLGYEPPAPEVLMPADPVPMLISVA